MKKNIGILLSIAGIWAPEIYATDYYPVATVEYVSGVALQYGCQLTNRADTSLIVNMEYLLKTVDICNAGITTYGTGQYATNQWANTYAVDWSIQNLVLWSDEMPNYIQDGLVIYYDSLLNQSTTELVDLMGNYNAQLFNTTGGNRKSVVFNGSSSYALIDAAFNPANIGDDNEITIEFAFKNNAPMGVSNNRLLYFAQSGFNAGFFQASSSTNLRLITTSTTSTTYDFGVPTAGILNVKMTLSVDQPKANGQTPATEVRMNNVPLSTLPLYNNYSAGSAVNNQFTIGRRSTGNYFPMDLYAIRIYNRKLTADETSHNYELDKVRFGF